MRDMEGALVVTTDGFRDKAKAQQLQDIYSSTMAQGSRYAYARSPAALRARRLPPHHEGP